jgi:hypothetical protein
VLPPTHLGVQLLLINHGIIGFRCGARFCGEIGKFILFLKLLLWAKLGTSNLGSCLHHNLWVELHHFFINVFLFFSLELIGSFAMTFGGGLTLSKLSIKPLTQGGWIVGLVPK